MKRMTKAARLEAKIVKNLMTRSTKSLRAEAAELRGYAKRDTRELGHWLGDRGLAESILNDIEGAERIDAVLEEREDTERAVAAARRAVRK